MHRSYSHRPPPFSHRPLSSRQPSPSPPHASVLFASTTSFFSSPSFFSSAFSFSTSCIGLIRIDHLLFLIALFLLVSLLLLHLMHRSYSHRPPPFSHRPLSSRQPS